MLLDEIAVFPNPGAEFEGIPIERLETVSNFVARVQAAAAAGWQYPRIED